MLKLELSTDQVAKLKAYTEADIFALKNHIASAVENPGHWAGSHSAPELVRRLREAETLQLTLARVLRAEMGTDEMKSWAQRARDAAKRQMGELQAKADEGLRDDIQHIADLAFEAGVATERTR